MTTFTRASIVLATSALIARVAASQQASGLDTSGGRGGSARRATLHATAMHTAVTLDGRLDESFWATADSIDDFRQREPREGSPATERTVVKVAHDAGALYIAVRCYDADMRRLRASDLRRDADLSSDDNVRLLIDSYDDRRSAFVFGTNPNGAMWDAQFSGVDDLNENWSLGRRRITRRGRMDGRVPHSVSRAAVSGGDQPDVRVQRPPLPPQEE